LEKPISAFALLPLAEPPEAAEPGPGPTPKPWQMELDNAWQRERRGQAGDGAGMPGDASGSSDESDRNHESFQEDIREDEAVRIAYREPFEKLSNYLKHGLSVRVDCDKMLTEFIYEYAIKIAGRKVVLDTEAPSGDSDSPPPNDNPLRPESTDPMRHLPHHVAHLRDDQVLVLQSLDMLDKPETIETLYQHTKGGKRAQLLGFLDPSLEIKKVLSDRFSVRISFMGLDRYVAAEPGKSRQDGEQEYTVSRLLTQSERNCFADYQPEELFKTVSGLNALQFRNAMRYVSANVSAPLPSRKIFEIIRDFKTSNSADIEIPDTRFGDIGGYEPVKTQLERLIRLMKAPIPGMKRKDWKRLIPRGFVFHGPPGTGKTMFAKAIANELNATIQMISGPEIMDKYVGESENRLRRIFATARRNAPAVIFFDEFDSIAGQRSGYSDGGARANNAVVAQLLTELDGFREEQTVLVIGTTNRIDIIDEALLRPSRLRPLEIGRPDHSARRGVADKHAKNFGVDQLLIHLCKEAQNYPRPNGGDETEMAEKFLKALCDRHPPYRERYEDDKRRAGFLRDLGDFLKSLEEFRETDPATEGTLQRVSEAVLKIGEQNGVDLTTCDPKADGSPMAADLRDLLAFVRLEASDKSPDLFYDAVIDLVAEYTEKFNNDEIRAIFQEAALEHHMEGELVTPRYLGKKIGLIHKRRDERQAQHLATDSRNRRPAAH
jgi:SpoVK/Ycf46/Vps4 family AAA+-type ATPase